MDLDSEIGTFIRPKFPAYADDDLKYLDETAESLKFIVSTY